MKFEILVVLVSFLILSSNGVTATTSPPELFASGGSGYTLSLDTSTPKWDLGRTYEVTVKITLLSFGDSSISDLHDIVLFLRIRGSYTYLTQASQGYGIIKFLKGVYSHTFTVYTNISFESSFKIEANARFRENVAFAFDPVTEVGWISENKAFSLGSHIQLLFWQNLPQIFLAIIGIGIPIIIAIIIIRDSYKKSKSMM